MFPKLKLTLIVSGEPLPSVIWYMDDKLLDDTYQQTFEGVVKNDLTIRRLKRLHTLSKLRCLASNNNLTRPVETSVTLKMLCKNFGIIKYLKQDDRSLESSLFCHSNFGIDRIVEPAFEERRKKSSPFPEQNNKAFVFCFP